MKLTDENAVEEMVGTFFFCIFSDSTSMKYGKMQRDHDKYEYIRLIFKWIIRSR